MKISVRAENRNQEERQGARRCEDVATVWVREPRIQCYISSFFYFGTKKDFKGNPAPHCFPLLSCFSIPSLLFQLVMACLGECRSGCREMAKMNSGEPGWLILRVGGKWDLGGELWMIKVEVAINQSQ